MERINDYGIPELVCDRCGERIYDGDEPAVWDNDHFHEQCFLEWYRSRNENSRPATFPHDHLPEGSG